MRNRLLACTPGDRADRHPYAGRVLTVDEVEVAYRPPSFCGSPWLPKARPSRTVRFSVSSGLPGCELGLFGHHQLALYALTSLAALQQAAEAQ